MTTRSRLLILAAAMALSGAASAHPIACQPLVFPVSSDLCDAPIWGAWDGGKMASRGLPLRELDQSCELPSLSPGWALMRIEQAPYPVGVIQALYQVMPSPPQVHVDPASRTGCEISAYQVAYRSEAQMRAAIETLGRTAMSRCSAAISYGSLGPGRTDYGDICALAAGIRERIASGESITDPGAMDAARWCEAWQRDCAAPALEEAQALIAMAISARTAALSGCDPAVADPAAPGYCLPAPDLCGDGWTHDPCGDELE
jgi:hypothetical protein